MYNIKCPYCEHEFEPDTSDYEYYSEKSELSCSKCEKVFFAAYDPIPSWETWTKEQQDKNDKFNRESLQRAIEFTKKNQ